MEPANQPPAPENPQQPGSPAPAPAPAAPPASPARKGFSVGRVVLLLFLLLTIAGGAWYWNDSTAVDNTNACIEKWNSCLRLLQSSGPSSDPASTSKALQTNTDFILDKKGGQGPLSFLTREEVRRQSADIHQNAASLRVVAFLIQGDVAKARAAHDEYKKIEASYEGPAPKTAGELAAMADKLLATPDIDKMSPELLRASVWAGMTAAMGP